jgi:hypothetical protein
MADKDNPGKSAPVFRIKFLREIDMEVLFESNYFFQTRFNRFLAVVKCQQKMAGNCELLYFGNDSDNYLLL